MFLGRLRFRDFVFPYRPLLKYYYVQHQALLGRMNICTAWVSFLFLQDSEFTKKMAGMGEFQTYINPFLCVLGVIMPYLGVKRYLHPL